MKGLEAFPASEATKELSEIDRISEEIGNERIDPRDFTDTQFFTEKEVDDDLSVCRNLQKMFEAKLEKMSAEEKETYERGLKAEYVLRHALKDSGWLSADVNMIVTSQYDDYVRGIDSVAQIITGDGRLEHLGLAIDFATSREDLERKLWKTFHTLDQGFSPSVKYFESEKTGKLKNFKMPRLVIGAAPETIGRLSAYTSEIMAGTAMSDSVRAELEGDPFRYVLMGEILAQLGVFINHIKKIIAKAREFGFLEVEKRAKAALSVHIKAMETVEGLAKEADIDPESIQKQIRGDSFAIRMAGALSDISSKREIVDIDLRPPRYQRPNED
ncbi:MAG: hypothetical protein KGI66_03120 [Patescibacteria group bacterium]|nr:hypothetical protein [Patescibacteria group bacterium]